MTNTKKFTKSVAMLYQVQNMKTPVRADSDLSTGIHLQALFVTSKIEDSALSKQGRIEAHELFSLFTANIIKERAVFTR